MAAGTAGVRRFRLYRPPDVAFGAALPLVVMLHGCGQSATEFALSTRMNLLARRERFFVLYPEQDRLSNPQGCWNWYEGRFGKAGSEADLLLAMVDQVLTLYPADRHRVVLAGLSAGAAMAALLAARHPARFAAVAMHSGVGPGAAVSTATALSAMRGGRAPSLAAATETALQAADAIGAPLLPPLMVLQGLTDTVVAPSNAAAAAEAWAGAVGASGGTAKFHQAGTRLPMRITAFERGGRERVRLCEVAGLGHAWSGGAASQAFSDPKGPDASRLVWAFAKENFAPR
ncbi:MAG: PHB depolymerase family esterase [Comamonadaceae bacterium]|nr:MAG: PHB depolymerase family esterase [Comamonadaceae bacterium]